MQKSRRKNIRIGNYNYSTTGRYFITICTWKKACLLGKVIKDDFKFSEIGCFVEKAICFINEHYENIALDAYTVMPNHIHLVISIRSPAGYVKPKEFLKTELDKENAAEPVVVSIPDIIRNFKSYTATEFYKIHKYTLWQRNYYDHIIRSREELDEILEYIRNNPAKWRSDKFYLEPGIAGET